jgi:hypothetical protein
MIVFSSNKSLYLAIDRINLALRDLKNILTNLSFEIAPEKCKSVIFTWRRSVDHSNITPDDYAIPFAPNFTYLDITLVPKLRWQPHLLSLSAFTSRWSNFLKSVSNT